MPVGDDTIAYRRHLPHLEKQGKTYFVTFRTRRRQQLPPVARTAALQACIALHRAFCWLECITIMPDHCHSILAPLEPHPLAEVMKRLKGSSSYRANLSIHRRGPLWQHESFDHILRSDESLSSKIEYICNNPVRAGLVDHWSEYAWTWRACDH